MGHRSRVSRWVTPAKGGKTFDSRTSRGDYSRLELPIPGRREGSRCRKFWPISRQAISGGRGGKEPMALLKEAKTGLIRQYRQHDKDSGSPEVQIAVLTNRITYL